MIKTGIQRKLVVLLALPVLASLCGCSVTKNQQKTATFFAMDTVMSISATGKNADEALKQSEQRVNELEQMLSVQIDTSDISKINRDGGAEVSDITASLLARSREYGEKTGGAFDVTILPVVNLWDITGDHPRVPSKEEIEKALPLVDYSQIAVSGSTASLQKPGMGVDLGGIAKGFAADEIARVMKENGITSAVLSLGGNVGVIGEKPDGSPWGVGIRDPHGTANEYVGILKLRDTFAVTSGGYERSFEQDGVTYHHIFDPKTGYPANNGLISVTIVSNDSTYADSLSTALYVMGYDKAMAFYEQYKDFEAVFITDQNLIRCTPGIASDFILTKSDSYHLG